MPTQKDSSLLDELKKHLLSLGQEVTSSLGDALLFLVETLQLSRDKKFVFLLIGRTGVGGPVGAAIGAVGAAVDAAVDAAVGAAVESIFYFFS